MRFTLRGEIHDDARQNGGNRKRHGHAARQHATPFHPGEGWDGATRTTVGAGDGRPHGLHRTEDGAGRLAIGVGVHHDGHGALCMG